MVGPGEARDQNPVANRHERPVMNQPAVKNQSDVTSQSAMNEPTPTSLSPTP
jgi:hypothetical protein